MKKSKLKKIIVVFSLCVFLLSLFSISSFALNISDVHTGYLYEIKSSLVPNPCIGVRTGDFSGYLVNKNSGEMTSFSSLTYSSTVNTACVEYFVLSAKSGSNTFNIVSGSSGSSYSIYVDYSTSEFSRSDFESFLSEHWVYDVTSLSFVDSMFDKTHIALVGGTNSDGDAYDGLLGMISKFGKFLVSSPLLLVLCIALPLVSFSVGLIIRIKNRA